MNIAELQKPDPAKNMARSYRIWVTPTLFGDYAVVREWGRIGSPGTVREEWFESEGEAIRAGLHLCHRKDQRGYKPLTRSIHLLRHPYRTRKGLFLFEPSIIVV